MFNRKNSSGLTLVEILLAIILCMALLEVLFQIYVACEQADKVQQKFLLWQENSLTSMRVLTQHLSAAGYFGCASFSSDFPFVNHTQIQLDEKNKIIAGDHAVTIWHAAPAVALVRDSMKSLSSLEADEIKEIEPNTIMLITDCKTTELFQVKEVKVLLNQRMRIVVKKKLNKKFSKDSQLLPLEIDTFYLNNKGEGNILFLKNELNEEKELIDGISEINLHYDVLQNGRIVTKNADSISLDDLIKGVSVKLKQENAYWYIYAALRNM